MANVELKKAFRKFDEMKNQPVLDHVEWNNLFLAVERGDISMSITVSNRLQVLTQKLFGDSPRMLAHYTEQLYELPNWFDF